MQKNLDENFICVNPKCVYIPKLYSDMKNGYKHLRCEFYCLVDLINKLQNPESDSYKTYSQDKQLSVSHSFKIIDDWQNDLIKQITNKINSQAQKWKNQIAGLQSFLEENSTLYRNILQLDSDVINQRATQIYQVLNPPQNHQTIKNKIQIILDDSKIFTDEVMNELDKTFRDQTDQQQIDTKYKGESKNGLKQGQGIYIDDDGSKYEGQWFNDRREGFGVQIYSNGDKYEGEWQNNKKHGKGVYNWKNGSKYEGEYQNNRKHGKGVQVLVIGNSYQGEFQNDNYHGKGVYKWKNGDKYEGEWQNDKQHGKGVKVQAIGNSYEGEYQNNKKHGKGVYKYKNGNKEEGQYLNDQYQEKQ